MAKECYAPCGQKLIGLSPQEAEIFIRNQGKAQGWLHPVIEQNVRVARAMGSIIQPFPDTETEKRLARYLSDLGFTVTPGNVDCPPQCGNPSDCPEAVL